MSPKANWPWSVLGLDGRPEDPRDIRRAYAKALKGIDQKTDIKGFTALRAAFEAALRMAEGQPPRPPPPEPEPVPRAGTFYPPTPTREVATFLPPPLSPEKQDTLDRATRADALRRYIAEETLVQHAGERIEQALKDPLIHDPDHEGSLRFAIVQLIRSKFSNKNGASFLSPVIRMETLEALDATYGWLSDYSAFRRDFWNDQVLLDLMASRVYGTIKPKPQPPARPKTKIGRMRRWIADHKVDIFLCYFALFCGLSMVLLLLKRGSGLANVVTALAIIQLGLLAVLMPGYLIVLSAAAAFVAIRRKGQRWLQKYKGWKSRK